MTKLPEPGQLCCGFTAVSQGRIESLSASTAEFFHPLSGAQVLCIQNDDRELGFSLIYRTPQLDETDACHMAEHLVLSSCKKYRSRDVFFDMDSMSYSTFMNGITDTSYTCYPICSRSEEQLLKLMDVVLCCMEEPDAQTEPHFFEREALRYELETPDSPLLLAGTVFSEDWAHLTDLDENADSHTARTLYPGRLAANLPGRAHLHYEDVSREQVMRVLTEFYTYSNCLIVLYGDMDYGRVLSFLDREHLSLHPAPLNGGSLISLLREPPIPGFRCSIEESPAYSGSRGSQASVIDYALDLSDCDEEELICFDLFSDLLDHSASPLHQTAKREGLNHVIQAFLDTLLIHPVFKFRLYNGDEGDRDRLLRAVRMTLEEICEKGIAPELYRACVKEHSLTDRLVREGVHLGCHAAEEIGRYWSLTGKTDYFALYERACARFAEEANKDRQSQTLIRNLAQRLLKPFAGALTVTVPVPGLAEQLESQRSSFLERKKASMTEEGISSLVAATRSFHDWNSREYGCRSFLISPKDLPAPLEHEPFCERTKKGITGFFSPAPVSGVFCFQIYFDLGFLSREDWPFLALYQLLLTEVDTPSLSSIRQKILEQELLHDCTFDEAFPGPEAGSRSRPQLAVFWYGLTADFTQSLHFLLELMGQASYQNTKQIISALEKYLPDYDLSQGENASSISYALAESAIRTDARFRAATNGQEIYYFLKDTLQRLKSEPEYGRELARRLSQTAQAILTKNRMLFVAAAPADTLPQLKKAAFDCLGSLPDCPRQADGVSGVSSFRHLLPESSGQESSPADLLPAPVMCSAVSLDTPSQEIRLMGDFAGRDDFKGRYLPFLIALSDRILKPSLRYRGGAYDCGADFSLPNGYFSLWCTADPGLEETVRIFRQAGTALRSLTLTEEELDGYVLSAFSQAQPLSGPLNTRMRLMRRKAAGICTETVDALIRDIPNASLECQAEAADLIQELIEKGSLAVAGSRQAVERAARLFERTEHLHS
ncbi:insulinase family protein [Clostridium sp. M62/1]|uniref:insulinase family protein n=1 Tax=Clostridium sp. M62/1 TaxID=411486 RepID=UPI00356737AC